MATRDEKICTQIAKRAHHNPFDTDKKNHISFGVHKELRAIGYSRGLKSYGQGQQL
jgi:hypothetical protein